MDSILIYKDNLPNKSIIPKNILLINHDDIGNLYNCRIVNPPFFKKIYIIHNKLVNYDLKRIYNMCLMEGTIYFLSKYKDFFNSKNNLFIKKNNNIYTLPSKRIVEFIIMGVQRGGTTSLAHNLSKHKDIYLNKNIDPHISEVHFFDLNWKKGINWYKKNFNYRYKLVGEKTPDLINLEYTFPLIQSVNPYIKLILILRNPIERAYSAWKLNIKRSEEKRTFVEAINYELKFKKNENETFFTIAENYLQRGLYYKQIVKLLKWFPKQNVLILISEIIKKNPEQEYKKIYNFLNIDYKKQNYDVMHVSDDTSSISDKKLYNNLIKYYKEDVLKLEKLLNINLHLLWFTPFRVENKLLDELYTRLPDNKNSKLTLKR